MAPSLASVEPFVTGAAALFIASKPGQNLYQHLRSPGQRPAAVRDALLSAREHTNLRGDPDHVNEGVIDLRRL